MPDFCNFFMIFFYLCFMSQQQVLEHQTVKDQQCMARERPDAGI